MTQNDAEKQKAEALKVALQQIAKEWLDEKYRQFGRYSFWGLVALAVFVWFKGLTAFKVSDLKNLLETAQTVHGAVN